MLDRLEEEILRSLRRITRAIDIHSRYLSNTFGLTGPQLVCLRTVKLEGELTPSQLADRVSLSQATVTGIVDRLVTRQLVSRERSRTDRRVVTVAITDAGTKLIEEAPSPLQHSFLKELGRLSAEEQERIRSTLERIATMMGGDEIKAAPVLTTSSAALSAEEITEVVDGEPSLKSPLSATPEQTPAIDDDSYPPPESASS